MLRRDFDRVSVFRSTTFSIVVNFIFVPIDTTKGIFLTNIMSTVNSIVFIMYLIYLGIAT